MYTRYAQHTVIWFIIKQTIGGSSISCWFVCNLFQNVSIGEDYCGEFDFNNPIDGPFVMMSKETIKLNTRASSLINCGCNVQWGHRCIRWNAIWRTHKGKTSKYVLRKKDNLRYVACLKHSDLDAGGGFIHKVEGL